MSSDPLPPTERSDPPVARILERAGRLSQWEAEQLAAALHRSLGLHLLSRRVLDEHQRFLNVSAMFPDWPDPALEMAEARRQVAVALGAPIRHFDDFERDDGSIGWGAATAAAYAVLGSGRASSSADLRAPWEEVIGR